MWKLSPYFNETRIFNTNVLTLEQKKIFHVRSNDQNDDGLDISYIKSEPPIGAPKAADTPAAAPAHAISRLSISLWNLSRYEKGRYRTA